MPWNTGKTVSRSIRKMEKELLQSHCFTEREVWGILQWRQAAKTVVPAQWLEIPSRFPQTSKSTFPAFPIHRYSEIGTHLQEDFGEAPTCSSQVLPKAASVAPGTPRTLINSSFIGNPILLNPDLQSIPLWEDSLPTFFPSGIFRLVASPQPQRNPRHPTYRFLLRGPYVQTPHERILLRRL